MYLQQTRFFWTTGQSFPSCHNHRVYFAAPVDTQFRCAHTSGTPRVDFLPNVNVKCIYTYTYDDNDENVKDC